MTIGAPNNAVMILIGNVPNGKTSVKIENNNIKNIPETKKSFSISKLFFDKNDFKKINLLDSIIVNFLFCKCWLL